MRRWERELSIFPRASVARSNSRRARLFFLQIWPDSQQSKDQNFFSFLFFFFLNLNWQLRPPTRPFVLPPLLSPITGKKVKNSFYDISARRLKDLAVHLPSFFFLLLLLLHSIFLVVKMSCYSQLSTSSVLSTSRHPLLVSLVGKQVCQISGTNQAKKK